MKLNSLLDALDNASWKKRALYLFLFSLLAWGAAFSFWSDASALHMRRSLQRARFNDLIAVLREYSAHKKAMSESDSVAPPAEGELLTTVSNVVGELGLRSNMVNLSTAASRRGRSAVSITLENLSAEKFAMFLQELDRRGIVTFSADLRTVRASDEKRTLTAFLLLGVAS